MNVTPPVDTAVGSTQLRLLPKTPGDQAAGQESDQARSPRVADARDRPGRPVRARVSGARAPRARRAAHWGDRWRLDARTREVGRSGVARARAALARAHDGHPDAGDLRRAS
jgi:hypothetical protein